MKIRSITSFIDPLSQSYQSDLDNLARFNTILREAIEKQYISVQSTRLATSPFPNFLVSKTLEGNSSKIMEMEQQCTLLGWDYLSLGPALPSHPNSYALILEGLRVTKNTFFSAVIADTDYIFPKATLASAGIIQKASSLTPDGFANLRFAALANVSPFTPFMPAGFHLSGKLPAISFAIECADVVVEEFAPGKDLETSRHALLTRLEFFAAELTSIFQSAIGSEGFELKGFDFSPAPFPKVTCSLAAGLEQMGLDHIGGLGSLAAVAILADALDSGNWSHVGFNGLMLPVLEDSVLSERAASGLLTVKDLLLYSAVCGTGLDTLPLPGDISVPELNSILLDVAAMAVRLNKPLTARLMPIPSKAAGDPTDFNFEYFSNSRVMAVDAQTLSPPILSDNPIPISPRYKYYRN